MKYIILSLLILSPKISSFKPLEDLDFCETEIAQNRELEKIYYIDTCKIENFNDSMVVEYVKKIHQIAIEVSDGFFPSVTIAQAIQESNKGLSYLSSIKNNHFGIKCFSKNCEDGHHVVLRDDTQNDKFRVYSSTKDSFESHSRLMNSKRYIECKSSKSFEEACACIHSKGYATDKKYSSKLIKLIKKYKLYEFDK